MAAQSIKYDPNLPVDIEIKGLSPHVIAYAVYTKQPGASDWEKRSEGDVKLDEKAEISALGPVAQGTGLFVSLGLGGRHKGYKAEVDVLQNGRSVGASGTFFIEGTKKPEEAAFKTIEGVFS